ncbi:MAG: peptide chain release factor N(5)-glutamine methyltransferase [Deltaproteobacteria bacterium]|nr:peptide chain release factor N(5)-glutamine methyltransferase [Deltaproteobacteria bacterium]
MMIKEALEEAASALKEVSATARLDAELLLCKVTGQSRTGLIAAHYDYLSDASLSNYRELVARRRSFQPIAYLTGSKEFFGLEFIVNPAVLVPRPETELLVDAALREIDKRTGSIGILDLGTGSGCIAVSLAAELLKRRRAFQMTAIDRDPDALEVAKLNARRHGVDDLIEFRRSDWFSEIPGGARFDVILSNPPYVKRDAQDLSPELQFEPDGALYAEDGGLSCIEELISKLDIYLGEGGFFCCEIGQGQSQAVTEIITSRLSGSSLFESGTLLDLAGIERVVYVRLLKRVDLNKIG